MIAGDQSHEYPGAAVRLRRRNPLTRLSAAHLLMVLAAMLAFTVNLLVLRSRDDTVSVVAVAAPLSAGEIVTENHLKQAEVDVSPDILAGLTRWDDATGLVGQVAARPMETDELPTRGSFLTPAGGEAVRSMSVPIEVEHAVGGNLAAGDRIDLIRVGDEGPAYVVVDAEVLRVAIPGANGLTSSNSFYVVIAVDGESALEVAAAIRDGRIEIVRSTGSSPLVVTP